VRRTTDFHAFWEAVLASLLILGAILLYMTNYKEVHEINIFAVVLLVQSLPFIAAAGLAALERTQFNDFATWRALDARARELVARRPQPTPAPVVTERRELVP
jgi:hypothetical protein